MKKEERYESIPLENYDDGNFMRGLGYGLLFSVPIWCMLVFIVLKLAA